MGQQQAVIGSGSLIPSERRRSNSSSIKWILLFALLGTGSWFFITKFDYTPGSDLGYNLGLVGGVAMLLTLLYSLSKRMRFMYSWIQMKYWFYAHMFLGITGPIFILLHSKLGLESVNGTLAFCFMCVVFLSGFTGRFLSSRIRHGLDSRLMILHELKRKIGINAEDVRSKFHFAPGVNEHLEQFEASVLKPSKGLWFNLWHFLTLPFRLQWAYLLARRILKHGIRTRAQKKAWDSRRTRKRLAYGKKIIRAYLEAVRSVARVGAYERLFSLWHIVHIPLLFWLAITGTIHVLAVHMY